MVAPSSKPNQFLFSFKKDTLHSVSRSTVKNLAEYSGISSETQVIQMALSKFTKEILPAYEADSGDFTEKEITKIKNAISQGKHKSVKSSLI